MREGDSVLWCLSLSSPLPQMLSPLGRQESNGKLGVEAKGACLGTDRGSPSHSCLPFIPLPGHGRAGSRVPAGGEVSRPHPPGPHHGPNPPVALSRHLGCSWANLPLPLSPLAPHTVPQSHLRASKYCRCLGPALITLFH